MQGRLRAYRGGLRAGVGVVSPPPNFSSQVSQGAGLHLGAIKPPP